MLNASSVCGILHHLLFTKSHTAIVCKAVDINYFVDKLTSSNPDLIYDKNRRMIRNRKNNSKVSFFTKVGIGAALKGLNPENAFIVEDADEKIVSQALPEFKNVCFFSPLEF